jgi:hypothetical protein
VSKKWVSRCFSLPLPVAARLTASLVVSGVALACLAGVPRKELWLLFRVPNIGREIAVDGRLVLLADLKCPWVL